MDGAEDISKVSGRGDLDLDGGTSRGSIKSTKSLERTAEGSVHFAHSSSSIKSRSSRSSTDTDNQKQNIDASLKVPHKIIANWRQACDRTRDRTRDLLKRWRTLPEFEGAENDPAKKNGVDGTKNGHAESGWSVHVWTTWVDRFSVETSDVWEDEDDYQLTPTQSKKFSHFFTHLLDHDHDDLISEQDFGALIEVNNQTYITKEGWLVKWAHLISGAKNLNDFPVWLQYFGKVLFQVVNKSGSGIIARDELGSFYSSVLGLDAVRVGQILDVAYQAMTSNGDHPLVYHAYRLCFANYLLARYPNGPGQYVLGAGPTPECSVLFPVDYSALNAQPEDLEQYAPDQKSNRRSVIV